MNHLCEREKERKKCKCRINKKSLTSRADLEPTGSDKRLEAQLEPAPVPVTMPLRRTSDTEIFPFLTNSIGLAGKAA